MPAVPGLTARMLYMTLPWFVSKAKLNLVRKSLLPTCHRLILTWKPILKVDFICF